LRQYVKKIKHLSPDMTLKFLIFGRCMQFTLWVRILFRPGVLDCQWLASGRWFKFTPGTPVFATI